MKKVLFTLFTVFVAFGTMAQKTIKLNINHRLGNVDFAMNKAATTASGTPFYINRLQYYISGISVTHDGGTVTSMPDVYALIEGGATASTINLGSHNITTIEAVKFSVGVNTPQNNQDPAQWPATHALSPKANSMHWGWSAGYRFAVLEGRSGAAHSQYFEIHGLGNNNYFSNTITTGAATVGGELVINIYADYIKSLKNIDISQSVSVHGDNGIAATLMLNLKNEVFTANDPNTGIIRPLNTLNVSMYPNPSNGLVNLDFSQANAKVQSYRITDLMGRLITEQPISDNQVEINLPNKGIYFISLSHGNQILAAQKLVIQ